jgi:hypothetical protein
MRRRIAAALALAAASSLDAQTIGDMSTATPIAGSWSRTATAGGSEATFADAANRPQLAIRCTRLSRMVTIARPASAVAVSLNLWTTTMTRSLPAKFDSATMRLSADLTAFDPLLDAIAFSRGRYAIAAAGQPPLVVPAWAEAARVIEDCRV